MALTAEHKIQGAGLDLDSTPPTLYDITQRLADLLTDLLLIESSIYLLLDDKHKVILEAFCPPPFTSPDQERLHRLCPFRALQTYVHRTSQWHKQYYLCFSITDREIAFSAGLRESGDGYIGPFTTEITLTYKNVFTNIRNAYNPITGVFTAPLKGAYMFRISVFGQGPTSSAAAIYKNGEKVVMAFAHQAQNWFNSSNGVVLILEVGDVVYVRLYPNTRIFDNENNFNTFSGFLLFPLREDKLSKM
ncbi:complement C1q-like protein 4 [Megalobrama amblycephala]|uniref:complement C1q-like protein 4 n=1 Tax=Megalobrama amblycephala TaxID=75352 RepID=UPI002013FFA1|nr:complement C1q-like protein 4 [Megalobrama amblycephala]